MIKLRTLTTHLNILKQTNCHIQKLTFIPVLIIVCSQIIFINEFVVHAAGT